MELSKDVEIEGKRYRVGRVTAIVGSAMVAQILPKIIPYMEDGLNIAVIFKMLPTISAAELGSIQNDCLLVCSRYEENNPVPVMLRPGVWGVKELEYDAVTVMALTVHALVFNLAPFFTGGGLQTILQSVLGSNQLEQN